MMCLPHGSSVEGLEVNCPPRFTTVLGDNNHSGAPGHWSIDGNRFYHTKCYISHQILVNLFFPMKRNGHWSVDGNGLNIRFGGDWKRFSTH